MWLKSITNNLCFIFHYAINICIWDYEAFGVRTMCDFYFSFMAPLRYVIITFPAIILAFDLHLSKFCTHHYVPAVFRPTTISLIMAKFVNHPSFQTFSLQLGNSRCSPCEYLKSYQIQAKFSRAGLLYDRAPLRVHTFGLLWQHKAISQFSLTHNARNILENWGMGDLLGCDLMTS